MFFLTIANFSHSLCTVGAGRMNVCKLLYLKVYINLHKFRYRKESSDVVSFSRPVLQLEGVLFGGGNVLLKQCTAEVAHFSLQWWTEPAALKHQGNPEGERSLPWIFAETREGFCSNPERTFPLPLSSAYSKLCSQLQAPNFAGADSFYVRVNLNVEPHGDPPSLSVSCDDIVHVTDTRYNGKYHWRCSLVDRHTAKPLQTGTMPNYNRLAKSTLGVVQIERDNSPKKKKFDFSASWFFCLS